MDKLFLYLLITLILAGVLFAQTSPQAEPSPSSVPAQESIAVPEGNGKPVLLDGLFARGEWDDALRISIHDRIKLFLKVVLFHLVWVNQSITCRRRDKRWSGDIGRV